jgi:hypothetical protein
MADVRWIDDFVAAWNSKDPTPLKAFLAEDCYWEDTAVGMRINPSGAIFSTSPDSHFGVEGAVCDDDGYAIQWRWTGTHVPSGKSYNIRGASVGRRKDDLVVSQSDYWSLATLTEQLGGPWA